MTAKYTCTGGTHAQDFELANEVKKEGGSATQDCRTASQKVNQASRIAIKDSMPDAAGRAVPR